MNQRLWGSLLFISLLASLFTACKYPLTDEYYREVKKIDTATISIQLSPGDSILVLAGITRFSYQAFISKLNLYEIRVFADSTEILVNAEKNGWFTLDCNNYSDGLHLLTLIATTNSGSGSLADLVGAEGFRFTKTWNLIVDKSAPGPVEITGLYNAGGILRIEWEKYTRPNFWRYEVLKSVTNIYGKITTRLAFIDQAGRNFMDDSSYVGGKAEYFVRVLTPMYLEATGQVKSYVDSSSKLSIQWVGENRVKLSWDACRYYKAFQSYSIRVENDTLIEVKDVRTTSVTGNFGVFDQLMNYAFSVNTQRPDIPGGVYSEQDFAIGLPFPTYTAFLKNQVNNEVFLSGTDKLYKYNLDTGQYLDSLTHPGFYHLYVLSPSNEVLLVNDYPVKKIDPYTLSVTTLPGVYMMGRNLSLSSAGVARVDGKMALYDYKNLQKLSDLNLTEDSRYTISEDDNYLFLPAAVGGQLNCYSNSNGQQSLKWTDNASDFRLIPGDPDHIILINYPNGLEVRSVSSNQVSLTIHTPDYTLRDVDAETKLVRLDFTDGYDFYNYETGQKVKTIKASWNHPADFKNGVLYSGGGYMLPILNVKK